jgi:hypothetical protein
MNTNLNKLNVDNVRKSGQILCDLYNSDNQSVKDFAFHTINTSAWFNNRFNTDMLYDNPSILLSIIKRASDGRNTSTGSYHHPTDVALDCPKGRKILKDIYNKYSN